MVEATNVWPALLEHPDVLRQDEPWLFCDGSDRVHTLDFLLSFGFSHIAL